MGEDGGGGAQKLQSNHNQTTPFQKLVKCFDLTEIEVKSPERPRIQMELSSVIKSRRQKARGSTHELRVEILDFCDHKI